MVRDALLVRAHLLLESAQLFSKVRQLLGRHLPRPLHDHLFVYEGWWCHLWLLDHRRCLSCLCCLLLFLDVASTGNERLFKAVFAVLADSFLDGAQLLQLRDRLVFALQKFDPLHDLLRHLKGLFLQFGILPLQFLSGTLPVLGLLAHLGLYSLEFGAPGTVLFEHFLCFLQLAIFLIKLALFCGELGVEVADTTLFVKELVLELFDGQLFFFELEPFQVETVFF